jgi:hypothetical protein
MVYGTWQVQLVEHARGAWRAVHSVWRLARSKCQTSVQSMLPMLEKKAGLQARSHPSPLALLPELCVGQLPASGGGATCDERRPKKTT